MVPCTRQNSSNFVNKITQKGTRRGYQNRQRNVICRRRRRQHSYHTVIKKVASQLSEEEQKFRKKRKMNLLNRWRTRVFGGAFLLWLFLMVATPKIPHSPEHHVFADKRNFLGVPNTWNVITNYPFLIVGVLGFVLCIQRNFLVISSIGERFGWALFYAGTAAKAYGSAYYHLKPGDGRFIWDTVPMMVAYTAMFSCLVIERVGERIGLTCLGVLVFLTFISSACERNLNDLRLCMMFQTIPCVAIPCVVLLSTPKYTHSKYWNWATGAYILTKFEASSDNRLYKASRYAISGHTAEHLCSSVVPLVVTLMLMSRSIRTPPRLSDGKERI